MAFDEVRFPDMISRGARGGPQRRTQIVTMASGDEERNASWANSRRAYDAAYGIRRADDLATVIAFFEARNGRLRGFRWKDWADYKSCLPSAAITGFDQAFGIRTQQRLERLGEIARGHALDIKLRQQFLNGLRLAQIPRQDAGREGDLVLVSAPIPHAWHLHGHQTNAGHYLPFWQMTMANQACPAIFERLPGIGVHEHGQLCMVRLFDQLARAIPQDVCEWVR